MESTTTLDSAYSTTDTASTAAAQGVASVYLVGLLVITIVVVAALWKMFTKAGKPGWASIVPFYNLYVLLQIVGRPVWWFLLFLVPFVNLVISIVLAIDTAKAFGKDALFGILGNFLFAPIGYLIIGFGSAQYVGPVASQAATPPPTTPAAPQPPVPPQAPTVS